MRITVVGTGGVGGYFGGRLALAGNDVTFIARGNHLEAILKDGLIVKSFMGEFTIKPAKATANIDAVKNADLVIICTKAWQIKEIAQRKNYRMTSDKKSVLVKMFCSASCDTGLQPC